MGNKIEKLLAISSPSLCASAPHFECDVSHIASGLVADLSSLLRRKNGFLAFESSLHVFPAGRVDFMLAGYDLCRWNDKELWIDCYHLPLPYLFFAEDVFGGQWAMTENGIIKFDPETGAAESVANDLEEWASSILSDYKVETGWPLAHQWQQQHGMLPANQRLVPKMLFALGGTYLLENLFAVDAVEGMQFRADIARQILGLRDGTNVQIITEKPAT